MKIQTPVRKSERVNISQQVNLSLLNKRHKYFLHYFGVTKKTEKQIYYTK